MWLRTTLVVAACLSGWPAMATEKRYSDVAEHFRRNGIYLVDQDCSQWPVCRVYWRTDVRGTSATAVMRVDFQRDRVLTVRGPTEPRRTSVIKPQRLEQAWSDANEVCRGSSGMRPGGGCDQREKITRQLEAAGWCFRSYRNATGGIDHKLRSCQPRPRQAGVL